MERVSTSPPLPIPSFVTKLLQTGPSAFLIGLLGVILVGEFTNWFCAMVKDNLTMTPLFLLPIVYTSWYAKRAFSIILLTLIAAVAMHTATASFAVSDHVRYATLFLQFVTYNLVGFLVMHLRRSLQSEQEASRRDSLTGLLNSRGFYEVADLELARMRRSKAPAPLSVLFLDVDHFKDINDEYGHRAGDEALKVISRSLHSCTRRVDILARVGGDEFALLMPETQSEHAKAVTERIQAKLRELSLGRITCSFGCNTLDETPASVDELLKPADEAMYMSKQSGKDRVTYVDTSSVTE